MTFRQQLLSSSNCCLLFSARGRHREQQIVVDVAQLVGPWSLFMTPGSPVDHRLCFLCGFYFHKCMHVVCWWLGVTIVWTWNVNNCQRLNIRFISLIRRLLAKMASHLRNWDRNWFVQSLDRHCKKVKFSHTRYRLLGPELIPVYRQSARRWLFKSSPAVGHHYFSRGLRSPCQTKNITVLQRVLLQVLVEIVRSQNVNLKQFASW